MASVKDHLIETGQDVEAPIRAETRWLVLEEVLAGRRDLCGHKEPAPEHCECCRLSQKAVGYVEFWLDVRGKEERS